MAVLAVTPDGGILEITQDRALRAIIAVARVGELLDGISYRGHGGDFRAYIGDMIQRQPFDIPTGAALVLPEIE